MLIGKRLILLFAAIAFLLTLRSWGVVASWALFLTASTKLTGYFNLPETNRIFFLVCIVFLVVNVVILSIWHFGYGPSIVGLTRKLNFFLIGPSGIETAFQAIDASAEGKFEELAASVGMENPARMTYNYERLMRDHPSSRTLYAYLSLMTFFTYSLVLGFVALTFSNDTSEKTSAARKLGAVNKQNEMVRGNNFAILSGIFVGALLFLTLAGDVGSFEARAKVIDPTPTLHKNPLGRVVIIHFALLYSVVHFLPNQKRKPTP